MMNNEVIISPNVEEKSRDRSVWGPWATTGFGVVVLVVFVIAQVVALGISGVVIAFSQAAGTLQPDEVVDLITDTLNANMGLLESIATIAAGIIGTGLILIVIKSRKRAG